MRFQRSLVVLASLAAFGLGLVPAGAPAQTFTKPVRIIVPFAPGGGTDNLTRIMAPRLTELLGQTVIVDNRAGANSQIGTELAARAAPDGHTLLHVDTSFTSNPSLFRRLPYDAVRDFAPISLLASAPVVLIVHPSVPVKSLNELIAADAVIDATSLPKVAMPSRDKFVPDSRGKPASAPRPPRR